MQDRPVDNARRAAEAFLAANRAEDPGEAARLRQEGYRLVELIKEEDMPASSSAAAPPSSSRRF